MKISVCMATFNGEKYIKKQLDSILSQLGENDELIISDDSSNDETTTIIKSFTDYRIKLIENQVFKSPIFNFENAIKNANGDIIVLSDQDDIWETNKLKIIKESFNNNHNINLKIYNGRCIDKNSIVIYDDLFHYIDIRKGLLANIVKNSFIGCNIAFSKKLLDIVLPFPEDIPMHDMWLSSNAYLFGEVEFIDVKIFKYRLHDNNYTGKKNSVYQKLIWRIKLIKNLFIRYINVKYSN